MRRSGRAKALGPTLSLATHALMATPPIESSSKLGSPKQRSLHRQSKQAPSTVGQNESGHLIFDDVEDEDPHQRFFEMLQSSTRTPSENEDLQDWLLHEFNRSYVALLNLSHNNPHYFRELLQSVTLVSKPSNEYIVRQDVTPTGSVFIVMSGNCTEVIKRHRFNLTKHSASVDAGAEPLEDIPWRTLSAGDIFGLESLYFQFPHHYISLRADGCVERNVIGVSNVYPTNLLVIPSYPSEKTKLMNSVCVFDRTAAAFLEHTYLFHTLPRPSLEFLASHLTIVSVHTNEYLYTAGQPPSIYLVFSGELRVYTVEDVVLANDGESEVVTRRVELQILKSHDCTGLAEVCLNSPGFSNYCVASTEAKVYIVPTYALFAVVKAGMPVLETFLEYFTSLRTWYKLRRFTALNRHNKRVDYRLTCSSQRTGPIACPRCGICGHMSDSMQCKNAGKADVCDDETHTIITPKTSTPRLPSSRELFLQRKMSDAERDIMLENTSLPEALSDADKNTSMQKIMRRLDRALGIRVPANSYYTRRNATLRSRQLRTAISSPKRINIMPEPPVNAVGDCPSAMND